MKYKSKVPGSLDDIPNLDPYAVAYFMPYLGRNFGAVTDGLKDVLRNAVAHLDPGKFLTTDDFIQIKRCTEAIPITKYIAREMLIEEMNLGPDAYVKG